MVNLVVLALGQSAITRLSRMFAAGQFKRFRSLLLKLSMYGVLIAATGVPLAFLFGRPLLTLLYSPVYGDQAGLLALFMGTAGLSTIGSFLFCGASAARSFRVQVPVYFAATLSGAGCGEILVPKYGLMGAGIAFLLSVAVIVAGGVWVMHWVLKRGAKERAA
jgi:O-antigen/teichoic acid export membrane protein